MPSGGAGAIPSGGAGKTRGCGAAEVEVLAVVRRSRGTDSAFLWSLTDADDLPPGGGGGGGDGTFFAEMTSPDCGAGFARLDAEGGAGAIPSGAGGNLHVRGLALAGKAREIRRISALTLPCTVRKCSADHSSASAYSPRLCNQS